MRRSSLLNPDPFPDPKVRWSGSSTQDLKNNSGGFFMKFKKIATAILTAAMVFSTAAFFAPQTSVYADASANVDNVNPWDSGGQITLTLSGCDGYETITVVVKFDGSVTSASGWGFDSYDVNGSEVTATVSASGPNSWAFNGSVGIQAEGSGITGATLVSVEGDGTYSGNSNNNGGNNNGGNNGGNSGGDQIDQTPSATADLPDSGAVEGDDWLTTDGDKIVDMNGTEVWLTGLSWFGYNTGTNLFDGVWNCNLKSALESIADHGFNLIRVPISAELILDWSNGDYPEANYNHAYNPELESMNSLEIWEYVLDICEVEGIKIMLDIHSAETDAYGHNAPLWYTSNISTEDYYDALEWIAERYKDNDTIVAYDLKNEPHGKASETDHAIWNDSTDSNNWKYVAETAGNIILDANPNALIVIEGIQIYPMDLANNNFTSTSDDDYYNSWWGGNLRAVADYPIDFGSAERNAQIVYSPHDYGPAVYAQPWFEGGFTYESLIDDYWYDSWLYIDDQEIAPLLIGEWGGFMEGDNLTWMTYMRQLIGEYHLNHTFWCFNADSGDTGGLVLDDFTTWDTEKYDFVSEVLWQTDDGQFIGLDHEVPLGDNGISLSEISGSVTPRPTTAETEETGETDESETSVTTAATDETSVSESEGLDGSLTAPEGKDPSSMNKLLKTAAIVIICVFGAALIGLGTLVIVKKKKKSKN
ncbi:MAG: glycoside hydrolase family 5 protein [Clostridiales bacterium]|nr:glycoside hydrolase family 5 protein [Clostridiales bacterium]